MRLTALRLGVVLGVVMGLSQPLCADVIITAPTGGNNIPADKALNSTNGAGFTALGNLVITEAVETDFAAGDNQTLILSAPVGWRLNPGVGSITFTGSRDVTAASVAVTASNLTVTFSTKAIAKIDALTISGVQVQAVDGANMPGADHLRRRFENPGSAVIAGIEDDFTTFGLLNQIPGTARALTSQTQPSPTTTAGALFTQQPQVAVRDQFGNLCNLDNTSIVTASRAAGTGVLQGSLTQKALFGIASFTNLSHNVVGTITIQFAATGLTATISDAVVVGPAPADRLVFTTQPGSASAGVPFGIQPVVKARDQFGNDTEAGLPGSRIVTVALTSGTGTLIGNTSLDIGTNAGNGVVTFANLQLDAAGANKQITASASGMTNAVSASFGVSSSIFTKLQLLVPGETAAPGTASGKTGTPLPQAAGTPFNVTVNAVDANWNVVDTISDQVGITSSAGTATLPPNAALVSGTKIFNVTLNTVGTATLTATDLTNGGKTPNTSPAITVGGGTPRKLTIQTQPSSTATAGATFAVQPVIRVEDAGGNLVATDNGRLITVARANGTGTLQGTLTTATVNGLATFTNLFYSVAETITLNFTATGLTNVISGNVVVGAAAADRLVFSTQPGGASRAGSPLVTQPVVRAQDPFGNPSAVGLPANLAVSLSLTSGSGSLLGTTTSDIGTAAGNGIATYAGLECTGVGTNKQLTATASGLGSVTSSAFNVGGILLATGGAAISADTVGGAYTTLSGPAYYEVASGDVGAGTIILNAPAGFAFDTGGTAPTVLITRIGGSGANTSNINDLGSGTAAAITSRTATQITFTVSAASAAGVTCALTWQNVRVRPSAGTPLASGNLTRTGTSTMAAVTASSTSFGTLTEVVGLANRLAFTTQPGSGTAGAPFGIQPVMRTRDQFGNNSTTGLAVSKLVSLALTAGTGPLFGTTSLDIGTGAGNGMVSFTDLEIDSAGTNKQLTASASGFTNGVSSVFTVSAAAAAKLTIQTQPSASATAGTAFAQQPVIRVEDEFGNLRTADNTTVVTASRASGTGTLLGTVSRTAINGLVTFNNLSYDVAETMAISFASGGLTVANSSNVVVSPGAANRLTIQTHPSATASAGAAFAQQPVIRVEDAFGNLRSSDNSTVVTATRASGGGTLLGTTNVTAVAGVISFANLAHSTATNITIRFTSGSLSNATSSAIAVGPASASKLTIQTQPSATAAAGVAFAQQPAVRIEDPFGNLMTSDSSTVVTATRAGGSGTLQGTLTATAVNGVATFANLSHNVATNITITFSSGTLTSSTSSAVAVNAGAANRLTIQAQPSPSATAGMAFTPQPVIRIEDQFGNLRSTDNSTVVTASRATGTGALQGTASRTAAGGVVTFTNLSYNVAENITLAFASAGLTGATSDAVSVNVGPASRLTIQTQPSATVTAGVAFAQQPVIRVEDAFGNLRTSDNSTAITATRMAGSGGLQGATTITAANGVVMFTNLSHNVATNITIQFASGALTNATSSPVAVSPAAANRLTVQTQPSSAATAGVAFAQQPVLRIEDQFGNLISTDSASVITATRNAGSGVLQGATSRTAVNGLVNFTNLSHNVAATITIDFGSGSLSGATSTNVVVSPAAPNHLVIQTQPSPTAMAGVVFAQQPVIRVEDQFGNLTTNLTVTATRNAGSGTLQGTTTITSAGGMATFTNLSHNVMGTLTINFAAGSLTPLTSDNVVVSAGPATRLTIQTQPSSTATAGVAFAQQPVVRVEDAVGNLITGDNTTVVTATRVAGSGALQGTVTATAVNGVATFANLSHNVATNITVQFSSGSLTSTTSGTIAVSAAAADHLTLQTAPSASATAGAVFAQQPVVRIEDAFGNLRSSDNTTVVTASRGTGSAALQGTTNRTAVGGVVTFTTLSYNVAETITLNFASGSLTPVASGNVVVSPAAANRLTIQTQPSAAATAGAAFAQQPVIRIEDQFGNLRSADNSTLVTATRLAGSGTLQGATSVAANGGVVTFANLSHLVANNISIQFTSGSLSNASSGTIAVSPGAFTKLQLLVPGESAAPGTASGKTGIPIGQALGESFSATVNAVDANWNLVNTVSDTVGITSSDVAATLPANAPLVSGTRAFTLALNTAGTATVTASDISDNSKTANTSPAISVATVRYTPATGGSSISADATGVAFTNLIGPVYTEVANGNVGTGTIILKAPSGFVFDTGGTAPTVRINGGTASKNINGVGSGTSVAMTSVTATQLTFTVTATSSGGVLGTLTWQNVRVRPTAGTPLASGNLTFAGTASLASVSTNSNLGTLREVPGGARKLVMQTQPSTTATAGVAFAQQPVVQVQDQFGNLRVNDTTTVVTASRSAGSGVLQGTANSTAVAGLVAFSNLSHNVATNITILFTSGTLTNVTSSAIAVSPAAATTLAFATQPGNATAGAAFGTQPVLKSQDAFGNNSSVGLPANLNVALSLSSGTGPLQGTTSVDIGAAAGNGTASFSGLRIDGAGANKQLTATASGLGSVASTVFTVSPAAANRLTIQTQPSSTATAGTAFAQQPVIRIEDQFGNLRSSDNTTVVSVARNLGNGALQGTTTATASGGIASFANLSYTVAETMNMNFGSGALTGATSSSVTVNPAAANKLTIQTQPSPTATAGVAFAQQPVIRIEDQYGNLRTSDNTTAVMAARSAGSGTLQGTTTVTAVNGLVSFGNLAHNVATNITIQFTSGSLNNASSSAIAVNAAAANRLAIQTQPSASAIAGAAFTQQPVLRVEDAFGNFVSSDNSSVVTATRNAGSGSLQGTASRPAVNGFISFTNLSHNVAGTITINFAAGGLAGATSANVVVGAAAPNHFVIQTQPSPTATAGAAFAPQPVIRVEDQFGNTCANTNLTITATRNTGSGTLQGTMAMTTMGGVATFTNLAHNVAGTITINFAGSSLPAVTSDNVLVSATAASKLTMHTQPSATATAGVAFAQQPAVRIEDVFGNLISSDSGTVVTASRAAGSGSLQGAITATAVNGVATFVNLSHNVATNITIQFSGGSLSNTTSSAVAVSAAAADHLAIQTQPATSATAGVAFGPQPVIRIEDAFGNLRTSDNATVITATRNTGSGILQGTTSRTAVGGIVNFANLSYNAAEVITIDFAGGGLAEVTSGNVTVSPAAANRLTIQTQPSATATAGTPFAQQPVIRVEDQFGNLRASDSSTVVTATRAAGSGTLQGTTNVTAVNGVVTFANLAHNVTTNITIQFTSGSLTSATSTTVAVGLAGAAKLAIQTQPSATTTAGVAFAQQPVVRIEDPFGNLMAGDNSTVVTATRNGGGGVLQGTLTATVVNGLATFTNLSHNVATNITIRFTSGSLSNVTSSTIAVGAAVADHLAIQTAPSSSATAGVAFAQQPVIRIEDQFGNLRTADNSTVVSASRASGSSLLQGMANRTAVGGVVTFTNLSYNVAQTITLNFAGGSLPVITSGSVTVSPGAANRLTIQTQPSVTATAGVVLAQQPVIRVEDAFGNLRSGDNSTVVTAARSAGSGTLQGTTAVTASGGVVTFANLSHLVANNITILFTSGSLSNSTSSVVAVGPGAFTKLQLVVPGESTAPGTVSGKTGAPAAQTHGTLFDVTVNAVDANWNLVNTVSDTVGITSSDVAATLPANAALVAGTRNFSMSLNTPGSATVTATDVSDGSKTASTSPAITIDAGQHTPATGGSAISADTVGGIWTTLSGPVYSEVASGNVGIGTIVLNAPPGFVFDTGGTAPTILITRLAGSGSNGNNINDVASGTAVAISSRTATQITFTVTGASISGVTCRLTWQNLRVRPSAGTPLATGAIRVTGTATLVNVTTNSNFGTLREVAGAASKLVIQTQPSATATAGTLFTQQPAVCVADKFGNARCAINGTPDDVTIITAVRNAGNGALQGTITARAADGVAAFTNLCHNVATNITITFNSGSLTNTTSTSVAVSPATADRLVFTTQPANGLVGSPLAVQPVLRSRDPFGNDSAIGLGVSRPVTVSLSSGTGPLLGTALLDIGTGAGNGVVICSDLRVDSEGANKQLTASASGLTNAVSSTFSVVENAQTISFGTLANKTYGDTSFAVSATASSGLPVSFTIVSGPATMAGSAISITGAGTVTVRATQVGDTYWAPATPVDRSFTVAKAVLTVTADNKSRGYGTTNPTFTMSYSGFVDGENAGVLTGNPALTTTATISSSVVGSPYPINVAQGTLSAANYSFAFVPGTLTISKAPLTVTAVDKSRLYGSTNPPLTVTYSGFMNGESSSVLGGSPSLSTTATVGSAVAGSPYLITVGPGSLTASNYTFNYVNGSLNITPAPLSVSAANASRAYGVTNPVFSGTLSGVRNGDSITTTFDTIATVASPAGSYPIVPSLADPDGKLPNYAVAATNGTLTVGVATLVGTVQNASRPYGQANPTFTVQYSGFVNGEGASIVTGVFTGSSAAAVTSPVGTYAITGSGQSASNYAITYLNGTLTVTPYTLSVVASNASREYGLSNPPLGGTLAGVQNGDNITASYSTAATTGSAVGNYAISPSLSDPQGKLTNYTVSSISGVLTISPAALTVTANNATRLYGQTNPVFGGTLGGVRNGDNITASYATAATSISPAGSYAIVPNLADPNNKLGNYSVTSVNGTLNIAKVTLTVTANDASRVYGAPNPAFTVSYTGFINGDNASVLNGAPGFTTTATANSPVAGSPYVITASLGTLNALNYNFVFVDGQLTITPASSVSSVISSANPSPTGSNVTFSALLSPVAPSAGIPSGVVQFIADGSPLGSPVSLSAGVANLNVSSLSHGTHTISAQYTGDANFIGSTNTLAAIQVINAVPVTTLATYNRSSNEWLQISLPEFMTAHVSDAEADPLTLEVGSGTNGATVFVFGGSIYYLPSNSTPNRNTTDHLAYVVSDGFPGGSVTNMIRIGLGTLTPGLPAVLTTVDVASNGVNLTFTGTAGYTYQIQRTALLQDAGTVWEDLGASTTDGTGVASFTDSDPLPDRGFYRAVWRD